VTRTRKGDGQTALVTGASVGIGVDLAECFANDGYDLILAARTDSALRARRRSAVEHLRDQATPDRPGFGRHRWRPATCGRDQEAGLSVDVLVNNAGYGLAGAFSGSDSAAQLGMIDLNDRTLVELTHIYWPTMLANKRGGVLNVASTAAFQPGPLMSVYYASKAFVLSFSGSVVGKRRATPA
jgi:short-subunit dehydrogenase